MADHRSPTVLSALLDRPASDRPDALALTDGRSRLTWAEYRDDAAALAATLRRAGVAPGDRVGVHLPKSATAFVAVHAVLRAGAVVVPVDWFAPPAYAAEALGDAGVRVVVSAASGRRRDELVGATGELAIIDPADDHPSDHQPPVPVEPDDPAYIIYTSGSTGRPKGIVHTHASALAYARRAVGTYGVGPDDRLANIAPLHFDQSTFELYAGPLAGAAVLVVPDGVLRFPASLAELAARERVTIWYSVPYVIMQLVGRGSLDDHDLGSLRWVKYGGEAFPPADLAAAMAALPSARFCNVYGPAEVNQCTFHHLDTPPADHQPVPIGRAWDGVDLLIVDRDGAAIVGPGRGELLVSGPTMMREYWNRPDLTAASIITRPDDARRWYRTGDLVDRNDDGDLVFVGRADHQVKVRGHRIELEAIEAVLVDHPAVDACAAFVEHGDDDRVVAVVSPPPDDATRAELTQRCRDRLPRYAVPAEIGGLGTLPRTSSGKVDRRAAATAWQHSSLPPS